MRTALIAGATGLVGGACLQRLIADSKYRRVIAVVRRPMSVSHPKLESHVIDFERIESLEPTAIDDVYCALGTTIKKAGSQEAFRKVDFEYPKALAAYAKRCGALRIALVSSVGANASSSNFYLRVKGETEAAIESFGFGSTNIFRPSFLIGVRPEQRIGEQIAIPVFKSLQFLLVGGLRRYRPIHADTVVAGMVAAVKLGKPGTHIYYFDEINSLVRA
jgi:uncharacterized protein YbjT (DUF2867 family)